MAATCCVPNVRQPCLVGHVLPGGGQISPRHAGEICRLAWECLDVSLDKLEELVGDRGVSASLLRLLPLQPNFTEAEENGGVVYRFIILDLRFY